MIAVEILCAMCNLRLAPRRMFKECSDFLDRGIVAGFALA